MLYYNVITERKGRKEIPKMKNQTENKEFVKYIIISLAVLIPIGVIIGALLAPIFVTADIASGGNTSVTTFTQYLGMFLDCGLIAVIAGIIGFVVLIIVGLALDDEL
jgi:hypothetical protein